MKARFEPANSDAIEMTLTITMPLWKWRALAAELEGAKISTNEVRNLIRYMVQRTNCGYDATEWANGASKQD